MENLPVQYTPSSLACSSLITRSCHFFVTVSRYEQPVVRVGFVMDKMTLGQFSLWQLRFFAVSTDRGEMAYGVYHRCEFKAQLFKFLGCSSNLCFFAFLIIYTYFRTEITSGTHFYNWPCAKNRRISKQHKLLFT